MADGERRKTLVHPVARILVLTAFVVPIRLSLNPGVADNGEAERSREAPSNPSPDASNVDDQPRSRREGQVQVIGHSLADDGGPFLGLGASYFTALRRCKHDRPRLEADLKFLSQQGFNYIRVLSMVGHHPAWRGLEIAPVSFTTRDGRRVEAWPDYRRRLGELIDVAYDRYGLRTQITIFADAQLMPKKDDRLAHLRVILEEVVPGREQKIILLEVANEAWQNGFPGDEGLADLREFAAFLNDRTDIPVAITSDHGRSEASGADLFKQVYGGAAADLATWHFSRDRRTDDGWKPVYDCWDLGDVFGCPPAVSNEPIGPGSSVDAEREPIRLVAAAAFAFAAKLPAYVFHCEAGVFGKTRFEGTPGIERIGRLLRLLPSDLPDWRRSDGTGPPSPLTVFADGEPRRYRSRFDSTSDGCVRIAVSRNGDRFVGIPIGIGSGGLTVEANESLRFTAYDPSTGEALATVSMMSGERKTLPAGPGALVVLGCTVPAKAETRQSEE